MSGTFEDPLLKAAVKRAWGDEAAPADLRRRVLAALAAEPALNTDEAATREAGAEAGTAADAPLRDTIAINENAVEADETAPSIPLPAVVAGEAGGARWRFRPFLAWATAAAVLVGVALVGYRMTRHPAGETLPLAAATAMVATHDGCSALADHHLVPVADASDFATAGKWLSSKARVPVISVSLGDGWAFCGAGPCPVAGVKSGHLLFKRGRQQLSIFSLPRASFYVGGKDREYAGEVKGHSVAGFTKDSGIYCVVGYDPDGDLSPSQVASVRDTLMKDFSAETFTAEGGAEAPTPRLAILLEDGD